MCRLIGNKRNLIDFIETVVVDVRERLGGGKLRILDAFAGSSVVSRMLAAHSLELYSNDFEHYAHLFGKCFLEHPAPEVAARVSMLVHQANAYADVNTEAGIIANNYAPGDTNDIQQHERCFYTRENALRIDAVRRFIHENCSAEEAPYLLAPLLVQCSIRANTTGVFNAFMKKDGVGCWGGRTEASGDRRRVMDALVLPEPVFNPHLGSLVKCFCRDANTLIPELPELDLIYVDSPYNQHSYGSNYGLLNIIAKNAMPERVTENSGIPCDWQRSAYYKKKEAAAAMSDLLNKATARASYVLISFSDEGHIDSDTWTKILKPYHSTVYQKDHRSTMGTRNYAKRGKSTVVELLYLVWAKNKGLPPSGE
jgi:adenine-specific DNA-methyltransferase